MWMCVLRESDPSACACPRGRCARPGSARARPAARRRPQPRTRPRAAACPSAGHRRLRGGDGTFFPPPVARCKHDDINRCTGVSKQHTGRTRREAAARPRSAAAAAVARRGATRRQRPGTNQTAGSYFVVVNAPNPYVPHHLSLRGAARTWNQSDSWRTPSFERLERVFFCLLLSPPASRRSCVPAPPPSPVCGALGGGGGAIGAWPAGEAMASAVAWRRRASGGAVAHLPSEA